MERPLTAQAFTKLLDSLGKNHEEAGEKYEILRRTMIRFFEWRGAPFPEEHTDESFNRVAKRLNEGVEIKNIGAYCYEVARLICHESFKGHERRRVPIEEIELEADNIETDEIAQKEKRLTCLENCLSSLPRESRELITEYYSDENHRHIDRRRVLAERLGLRRDALANRAQRVREKLQQCVTQCLKNL